MKSLLLLTTSFFALHSFAVDLPDYKWKVTDVAHKGLNKEDLFQKMNRSLVKVNDSICSNRALVWNYDFKRRYEIDSAKIFLFYTGKSGHVGLKTWWYHVAPIINENGQLFVMDAGFPNIKKPLTISEWLASFAGSTKCKEIRATENDLIEKMFSGHVYPETTSYGTYDCYYKLTPPGYWTPTSVAKNLLGKDESGSPVHWVRDEIDLDEVYEACTEAVTNPFGRFFGSGKKKCSEYLGL